MRVAHTIAGLRERAGGVAHSVPGLCEALSRIGCRVVLASQRPSNPGESLRLPDPSLVETRLFDGFDWDRLRLSYTPRLRRRLLAWFAEVAPAIVHDHGLWLHMNHEVARATQSIGLKRVVSPRGMLQEWSMSYRGWRKRLAWRAYQLRDLQLAAGFSATSNMEAQSVRKLGFMQPIAVIPNGVAMPASVPARASRAGGTVVFMSRIHPKKGLLDLVGAWRSARRDGWNLVIAGPDEVGYARTVQAAVEREGLQASVSLVGPVEGAAKARLLASADLFVLPSYSENFGIVVAEALSYAAPVITTTATPWPELRSLDCGWWIEPGEAALAATLTDGMALSSAERMEMGLRGRRFVEERFSWEAGARAHLAFYRWLTEGGTAPDCLHP